MSSACDCEAAFYVPCSVGSCDINDAGRICGTCDRATIALDVAAVGDVELAESVFADVEVFGGGEGVGVGEWGDVASGDDVG